MLPFPLPLSVLMDLDEESQDQLKRLAWSRHPAASGRRDRRRSSPPRGPRDTWNNYFGRRRRKGLATAPLVKQ
jgi:hypothetical protein